MHRARWCSPFTSCLVSYDRLLLLQETRTRFSFTLFAFYALLKWCAERTELDKRNIHSKKLCCKYLLIAIALNCPCVSFTAAYESKRDANSIRWGPKWRKQNAPRLANCDVGDTLQLSEPMGNTFATSYTNVYYWRERSSHQLFSQSKWLIIVIIVIYLCFCFFLCQFVFHVAGFRINLMANLHLHSCNFSC